jgi:hypothetical protein
MRKSKDAADDTNEDCEYIEEILARLRGVASLLEHEQSVNDQIDCECAPSNTAAILFLRDTIAELARLKQYFRL